MSELSLRLILGSAFVLIVAFLLYFVERVWFWPILALLLATLSSFALWEYYQLLKKKQLNPAVPVGITFGILYFVALYLKVSHFWSGALFNFLPQIVMGAAFLAFFIFYSIKRKDALLNIGGSFFGLIYIFIPLGLILDIATFFYPLNLPREATFWLLYLVFVTKSADMGGYFTGRILGRHKLAKALSPNKTMEGALGGLIFSLIISLLIFYIGQKWAGVFEGFKVVTFIILGLLVGVLGQMGDLAESLLKRDSGVKDSNKIPGIGGDA